MKLSSKHKVGHRAYDELLIKCIKKINSFANREEITEFFCNELFNISSFEYLTVLETYEEKVNSLDDLKVFCFRTKRKIKNNKESNKNYEKSILKQINNISFNKRRILKIKNFNFELLNNLITKEEKNIGWGSKWTNLFFCLKFVPYSKYIKDGWVNIVYLKRATFKHSHRFLILWYPMKDENSLPYTFHQDERILYLYRDLYNLVSFSLKAKAKNIYEQKIQLLQQIAPSIISHEILTNIIQPIYTFKSIAKTIEDPDIKEIFDRNIEMLNYTKEMADNLLLFTKRASSVTISLQSLFYKVKKLTKHMLSKNSAFLSVENKQDITISSDEGLLMQIFMNLIINALDAYKDSEIKKDRKIYIEAKETDEDKIEIYISDNATGIDEKVAKDIFEQGFTTKKRKGHGLGLTISSYIAKYLGGTLCLKDREEFKTTFVLSIPKECRLESEIEKEVFYG